MALRYAVIESFLKGKILSGRLEPGQKLPTEQEMIAQFGVSRITIRLALSHLAQQRLIVKHPGKGTYVADAIPLNKQLIYTGNLSRIIEDGRRYETLTIRKRRMKVAETRDPGEIRSFYGIENDDEISRIERVRCLERVPICYLESYLPVQYGEKIDMHEISELLMPDILKRKWGIEFERGDLFIESIPTDPDIATYLHHTAFDSIMLCTLQYYIKRDKPILMVQSYILQDYFKYKVNIDVTDKSNVHFAPDQPI